MHEGHLSFELGDCFGVGSNVDAMLLLKLLCEVVQQDEVQLLCAKIGIPGHILDFKLAAPSTTLVNAQPDRQRSVSALSCRAPRGWGSPGCMSTELHRSSSTCWCPDREPQMTVQRSR